MQRDRGDIKEMTVGQMLEIVKQKRGVSYQKMAELTGTTGAAFIRRVNLSTIKADEFLKIMRAFDFEVKFVDKETGKEVSELVGQGRPASAYIGRVKFDTQQSRAIANDFYQDGEHKYNDGRARELYMDQHGRYFFVDYSNYEDERDKLRLASPMEVQDFIEKYGAKSEEE